MGLPSSTSSWRWIPAMPNIRVLGLTPKRCGVPLSSRHVHNFRDECNSRYSEFHFVQLCYTDMAWCVRGMWSVCSVRPTSKFISNGCSSSRILGRSDFITYISFLSRIIKLLYYCYDWMLSSKWHSYFHLCRSTGIKMKSATRIETTIIFVFARIWSTKQSAHDYNFQFNGIRSPRRDD